MDLLTDAVLQSNALEGKTALVCGASRGIGAATARIMAKAGANVIVASRTEDQLKSLLEELPALGAGHHQALVMDLEDTESIAECIQPLLDKGQFTFLLTIQADHLVDHCWMQPWMSCLSPLLDIFMQRIHWSNYSHQAWFWQITVESSRLYQQACVNRFQT